jgi:hypothetical protein
MVGATFLVGNNLNRMKNIPELQNGIQFKILNYKEFA